MKRIFILSVIITVITAACSKNSEVPVSSISINNTELKLRIGEESHLKATVLPADATETFVEWSTSDSYVATVSPAGVVTAQSPGIATVSASCGGLSATCKVTVIKPVTAISLSDESLTLGTGKTHQLTATVSPEDASEKNIAWNSSNSSCATVSQDGLITAIAPGTATVTASCGGFSAACQVTVYIAVTSITLNVDKIAFGAGDTRQLTATITPSNATYKNITWKSSNYDIAEIIGSGGVRGRSPGEVTVTATCDGQMAQCTVVVQDFVDLGLSVKWSTVNLGATTYYDCGDYYAWGELTTKSDYSWSTYKWCDNGADKLTKYNIDPEFGEVDDKTFLDPDDDVAHVVLGGSWRLPTEKEINELYAKCTWTWQNLSAATGFIVTGPNGNKMFIAANGSIEGTVKHSSTAACYYWTSCLDKNYPSYSIYLFGSKNDRIEDFLPRSWGMGIRAVCD